MAITYAYPTVTPELQDLLVGTEIAAQGGEDAPRTRTFTVQSIRDLVQKQTLQEVVNVGNSIALSTTKAKGIDITLSNNSTVYQNGIVVTCPSQTGEYPTYNPCPDLFVAIMNGQNPGVLTGSPVGFYANITGDDNYGFVADLKTGAIFSTGVDMRSFDSHTGDFYRATKYIGTADGVIKFKVDNNGNTTANSFIKTNGGTNEYLMADGNARVYTVTNSTQATAFTVATLNSNYPTATIGFTVQCTNPAVLKSYQKTSSGWISYSITNVV